MAALPISHSPPSLPSLSPHKSLKYPNTIRFCYNLNHINITDNNGAARFPEKKAAMQQSGIVTPPRPRRIILVRHGQSEGNVDESVYTRVPDPKIPLTPKGRAQAEECGHRIKDLLLRDAAENWKLYFYFSPYRRTIETLQCLARPFHRSTIAGLREEPRLREQDFGQSPPFKLHTWSNYNHSPQLLSFLSENFIVFCPAFCWLVLILTLNSTSYKWLMSKYRCDHLYYTYQCQFMKLSSSHFIYSLEMIKLLFIIQKNWKSKVNNRNQFYKNIWHETLLKCPLEVATSLII